MVKKMCYVCLNKTLKALARLYSLILNFYFFCYKINIRSWTSTRAVCICSRNLKFMTANKAYNCPQKWNKAFLKGLSDPPDT